MRNRLPVMTGLWKKIGKLGKLRRPIVLPYVLKISIINLDFSQGIIQESDIWCEKFQS